ncbi:glycine cleavage system aminomethyltransferase T [Paraburkholderia bryophila]|uniref:Glycine cleavage system aminomethyltransferase T n=2 Tax=Paraburkholderia TaxID=1822464 RepID=A0A7Y9WAN1_9BURK|nr:glycine cleavage system aminomethyltransferase T [Paraburkholderia bryophila]
MVVLTADGATDRMLWGGEAILRDGEPVGFVTSAAFGHTLGCPVAMGYVNHPDGVADAAYLTGGTYAIDVAGDLLPATLHLKAPYDPRSERVKG